MSKPQVASVRIYKSTRARAKALANKKGITLARFIDEAVRNV